MKINRVKSYLLIIAIISQLSNVALSSEAEKEKKALSIDNYTSLTADKRAKKVGDTVTIVILENAQAGSSAGNNSDGNFKIGLSGTTDRGDKGINQSWFRDLGIGINSEQGGDAANQRNGFIQAQLTAVVVNVDKNQNIIVAGKQTITIDGEEQTIEIKGKARVSDISSNNTLVSSRLFDAQISFTGQGEVSDGRDSGFFYKLFKWIGLI